MTSSTSTKEKLVAIVIGAGPAGLSTSLALAKVCKTVHLVERNATFEARGATFGVAKNGIKALTEIDPEIVENLKNIGIVTPMGGLMLPWWEMRDSILNCVRQKSNIQVHTGESIVEILDDDQGVTTKFESGLELEGDCVIGADGVHSSVRKLLGRPSPTDPGNTIFRGNLMVTDDSSDRLKSLLEKGIVPIPSKMYGGIYVLAFNFNEKIPGRIAWVISTKDPVADDGSVTPMTLLRNTVDDPEEWAVIEDILNASEKEHMKPYPPTCIIDMSDEVLETMDGGWGGRGRVALVGDAAHAMRPTNGQGGNMAFEDAVVLLRKLNELSGCKSIEDILAEYEATRLLRVKKIHEDQRVKYNLRMSGEPVPKWTEEFTEWVLAGV